MKIEQFPLEDHQVRLTVELEPAQLEAGKRRAARRLAERGKIPGFRPGKAPYDVIVRTYGEGAITEEAVDLLIEELYPKILEEAGVQPGAPGRLEKIESLDPPRFIFVVPLEPVVDLGGYREVRLPYEFTPPTEDQVNAALEEMRRMYGTTRPVERPIQTGDYVLMNLKGEKENVAEGENPIAVDRENHTVFVAPEERPTDLPYPGFPQALIGLSAGETKVLSYTFPADYPDEELRGRTVRYTAEIKAVRALELPELDDDFARTVGAGETLDELRAAVRADLERRAREEYDDRYFVELFDKIRAVATVKYPPQAVEHEMQHVLEDLKRNLAGQRLELDAFLKMRNTDLPTFMESEVRPVAVRRLERGLLMEAIAREEKIRLGREELEEQFSRNWMALAASDPQFSKLTRGGTRPRKDVVEAVAASTADRMMTHRILERMKARANGEPIPAETEPESTPTPGPGGESAGEPAEQEQA